MAEFLNTSGVSFYLERLIKAANERLILISPFLKFNDRIRHLLEDKNRLKIDTRLIYGKSELKPEQISWLKDLDFIRTSYREHLHAKCYMNENECIISSMNLYEFSQVNNIEFGILISRESDPNAFRAAYEEAQELIRTSDEIRLSAEIQVNDGNTAKNESKESKLSSSKIAKSRKMKTTEFLAKLTKAGLLELDGEKHKLTSSAIEAGGELRRGKFGPFFIWPVDIKID